MSTLDDALRLLAGCQNWVFFGGAGMSTASGIPDFRSVDGLYSQDTGLMVSPEVVLSHNFMLQQPAEFYAYLRKNLHHPEAKPGSGHQVLARWEQLGFLKAVITQNVDGLHQLAGSQKVIELHGGLSRFYCLKCRQDFPAGEALSGEAVPYCKHCGGFVRPDVVMYGEALPQDSFLEARERIREAQVLIVAGSSLQVYPAAGLIHDYRGSRLILMNRDQTSQDGRADCLLRGDLNLFLQEIDRALGFAG